jgi:hypothetical protein
MYFPDDFARLIALSERAHRFVLRWARRRRATRRRLTEYLSTYRPTVGSRLLWDRRGCGRLNQRLPRSRSGRN